MGPVVPALGRPTSFGTYDPTDAGRYEGCAKLSVPGEETEQDMETRIVAIARPSQPGRSWRVLAGMTLLLCQYSNLSSAASQDEQPLPSFAQVKETLARHFEGSGIEANDLICQSDVKPIFKLLQMLGWEVVDSREILTRVLPDNNFLVRQLKTKAGHKFMRQVAGFPQAYDRLDQLSHLPQGKQTIRAMIRGPDGVQNDRVHDDHAGWQEPEPNALADTHGGRLYPADEPCLYPSRIALPAAIQLRSGTKAPRRHGSFGQQFFRNTPLNPEDDFC